MLNCKDCIHDCYTEGFCEVQEICNFFVDKTKYVEVVRCKDCKHFIPFANECYEPHNYYTEEGYREVCDNDFCSYGERKDNDCT